MATDRPDPIVDAIFDAVAATAPKIRDALPGRRVEDGVENPSGETAMAADVYADELLYEALAAVDGVGEYVSEERADAIDVGTPVAATDTDEPVAEQAHETSYAVAVDPLDGSSNLRSNNTMGTIVGVYDAPLPTTGRDLVAAGYTLYGPITTMIVADASRVREEVIAGTDDGEMGIDDGSISRTVVDDDLTLPSEPTVYGFGGRVPDWPDAFRTYAREIEQELKLRYGGSMVGDVNQVLTYGGVFAYPALESAPDGKLRLAFEANPIAYVIERMGGASSDGSQSILDVEPSGLHDRVPVHVGNSTLIDRLETTLNDDRL